MGDNDTSSKVTTQQVPNPTGKGGFAEHPENRNPGGWKKENTISYQYNRFLNMSPDELAEWSRTESKDRTVAMDLAYNRVLEARKSLPDMKEITDRTEGKPSQSVDHTTLGKALPTPIIPLDVYRDNSNKED